MLDLNKYTGTNKRQVLHSSGIAQIQSDQTGAEIGAFSTETFKKHLSVLQKRQQRSIADYEHSQVATQYRMDRGVERAQTLKRFRPATSNRGVKSLNERQAFNATKGSDTGGNIPSTSRPQISFREPQGRTYNPYE